MNLDAFTHGFFQDILTLMKGLGKEQLSKEEIEQFLADKLNKAHTPRPKSRKRTRGRGTTPIRGGGRRRK